MKIQRLIILLSVIVYFLFYCNLNGLAYSVSDIPKYKANKIPEEFKIQISPECSGHTNFLQADANENGDFALLCYKEKNLNDNSHVFKEKYVDVYNADGEFCFEFIFITNMQPSMRMVENVIYLIFYNNILTLDIITKDINYYNIEGDDLWEYSNREIMQTEEFSAGEWHYKCKRNFLLDFVKLIRFNDNETTILVDMPGAQIINFYGFFTGIIAILIIFTQRHIKYRQKDNRSGDGSMSKK